MATCCTRYERRLTSMSLRRTKRPFQGQPKFEIGRSVISVDDTLKIIAYREQHKKLSALEMELAAARQEGFTSMRFIEINGTDYKRRPLVVIGIFTTFGRKNNRDAIRKAWMGTGAALQKMENEKGIITRGLFGTQCSNWKAISITRIIWKLTTTSFHLHNRGILLLLVFFVAGAGRTMLISDAGKVYDIVLTVYFYETVLTVYFYGTVLTVYFYGTVLIV
ncbi:uncharacterized protein LOC110744711 isoform X2 [Prunus avium]|uniref:Uncharacterized protein LOC110744711 isoform X2 n=1 Tax=Prunus avium TaxID=42229 RepID=A0A6P5RHR8_PRUAV|nr:uncharacterized protein LOC110744711 isoform X2 [Prunus avium]